jgi:hypothetical protein
LDDLLGNEERGFVRAAAGVADAVGEIVGRERGAGLNDASLAVTQVALIADQKNAPLPCL